MANLKLRDYAVPNELKCYEYYECTNCNFHIIVPKLYTDVIYSYKICPSCCNRIADVIRNETDIITMEYAQGNARHFRKINLENKTALENIFTDILLFFPVRITDEVQRNKWNDYVEENFIYLDEYRDEYDYPYLNTDEWHIYYNGDLMTLEKNKQILKKRLEDLDRIDKEEGKSNESN